MDKRGIRWIDQWAEIASFWMMVIGFLVAMIANSALVNYIIISMVGFMVGRTYHVRRSRLRFPFYLITIFFLGGYIIGTQIIRRGNAAVILVCFIIGLYIATTVYRRGFLR